MKYSECTRRLLKKDVSDILHGGNLLITVESGTTGARFTYKIRKAQDKEIYYVSVMTGSAFNFSYLGIITEDDRVIVTRSSGFDRSSAPVVALDFMMKHQRDVPDKLHIYLSDRCACCGRRMTTPESLENGYGPECQARLMLRRKVHSFTNPEFVKIAV